MTSKFELWSMACSGEIPALQRYYDNGGEPNIRYEKFGKEHSLIAGAFRNKQYKTVEYLLSVGETIMEHEKSEILPFFAEKVIDMARDVADYFRYHNKNLTQKQYYLIDDMADLLKQIPVAYSPDM